MDLCKLSAVELAEKIANREISAYNTALFFLERIEKEDKNYNSFITVCRDYALHFAGLIDEEIEKGIRRSPLAGVPIAVKDNISTKGIKTTCASKMLENYIPPFDATAAKKLKEAGLVIIGKTNMDEFGMGSTGENSYFGATLNPFDTERVAGGSSSGSAAAVSTCFTPLSLGTDTGGSVRQPAAFCSVYGLKPTTGAVSRNGLIAYASSLDQIGIFSKNISDVKVLLNIISGEDDNDFTSLKAPISEERNFDISKFKIAIPNQFFADGINEEIRYSVENFIKLLKDKGATVNFVDIPELELANPVYKIVSTCEVASNLSRFDGVRYGYKTDNAKSADELYKKSRTEGFGKEVKRRIILGNFLLNQNGVGENYKITRKSRAILKSSHAEIFRKYDVILGPTTSTPALKLSEFCEDSKSEYLNGLYAYPANLIGLPSLSIPWNFNSSGLPIGLQLTADYFNEDMLFCVADYISNNLT